MESITPATLEEQLARLRPFQDPLSVARMSSDELREIVVMQAGMLAQQAIALDKASGRIADFEARLTKLQEMAGIALEEEIPKRRPALYVVPAGED